MAYLLDLAYKNLWEEAFAPENYMKNRMYSEGCQRDEDNPIKDLAEIKPDVFHLCEFASLDFANILSQVQEGTFLFDKLERGP